MSEIEQALKRINSKLRLLEFTEEDVPRIQEKNELKAAERLERALEEQMDSVHEQMMQVKALRIEKGDEPDVIRKWSLEMENQLAKFEETTFKVKKMVMNLREESAREAKFEEEKLEEEKRKRRFEEELKLEEAKMEIKREFEKKIDESRAKSLKDVGAKLPKLVITKFQGTHLDWQRFWSQFETEIDKTQITQVAKFSYLKELAYP